MQIHNSSQNTSQNASLNVSKSPIKNALFFRYITLLLTFCALLTACTATFNWREIRSEEQGFLALFPAKTRTEQKNFPFKDQTIEITMEAAIADETLFAVSSLRVNEQVIQSTELIDLMQRNATKSIPSVALPKLEEIRFPIAGQTNLKAIGQGYQFSAPGPNQNHLVYWVYWTSRKDPEQMTRVYQLSAAKSFKGKPSDDELKTTQEQMLTFMSGFKPY